MKAIHSCKFMLFEVSKNVSHNLHLLQLWTSSERWHHDSDNNYRAHTVTKHNMFIRQLSLI